MNRNKIIIVNIGSAVLLAILWSAYLTRSGMNLKNVYSSLALISLVAAPVDMVAGLVCLALNKKVWASALLWSGVFFGLILVIGFAAVKM